MIGWLYILLSIAGSTILWPISRWTLKDNGNVRVMGFWTSFTAGLCCFILLILQRAPLLVYPLWVVGAVFGMAYAVGFIILIMRCLQIGPSGPTVTINNSAMIFGVLFGIVYLKPHVPNLWSIAGAVGVFAALAVIGLNNAPEEGQSRTPNREWTRLVLAGGALSGLSFMTQSYVGMRYPGIANTQIYLMTGFGFAAFILLVSLLRSPELLQRRRERLGGILLGLLNCVMIPVSLMAYQYFAVEIVQPVTVVSPMVLTLLIGWRIYREHLNRWVWVGCLVAAVSVGLIAYGSVK